MSAPESVELTREQFDALDIARGLARAGIPVFVAYPSDSGTGFTPPPAWEQTIADPTVVETWRPGLALCAVMGCGLDLIDVDPRNGGDAATMNGSTPISYGIAATPSGGLHSFIRSTGAGSRDKVWTGIDVKSGMLDGSSRGFAFIAPTVRKSKSTGEPTPYTWVQAPDLARLAASANDTSGEALAARIRELRAETGVRRAGGPDWWQNLLNSKEPQSSPAAQRAINEKLTEVREWSTASPTGFRQVLLRAALTLGGYVGGGYLDEADARGQLAEAVGAVWNALDADDALWIEQGLADGATQPFYVYTAEDEQNWQAAYVPTEEPAPGQVESDIPADPPWTDYSALGGDSFDPVFAGSDQELAEAVALRMLPALRYAIDTGAWLVRDRDVWREFTDRASWAVATVARMMPMGQTPVPKELSERTEMHWQAVRRAKFLDSAGASKIERKLKAVVQNRHLGGVEVGRLDTNPEVLWAGGAAWDLRASLEVPTLAQIDPNTPHLHTAMCAPRMVPTPRWDAFLAAVWPDIEVRAWAMRVLSIAFTGYADAALPVLYGEERNGKTSVVELLMSALGTYGVSADPKLLAGVDNAHGSIVYALKGARLAFIDEGPRKGHLAQERLKQLTGGGRLTGNAMRSNPITFATTHTLVMTSNDEPPVTDPALRARIKAIYCAGDRVTVRARRAALTPAVWMSEAPGVLAQMMAEAAAWLGDRDSAQVDRAPAVLRGAVEDMAAAQDPAREWVEFCTVPADPGTPARELYVAFARWFNENPVFKRLPLPSETAFGRSLNDQGFPGARLGRGNDRLIYRPLSVLGGTVGIAPWEPLPSAHMTPGYGTSAESGAGSGTVGEGPQTQPSPSENHSSTPLSSSFGEGGESNNRSIDTKNTQSPICTSSNKTTGETGSKPDTLPTQAGKNPVYLGKQAGAGTSDLPAPNSPLSPDARIDDVDHSVTPESSQSVSSGLTKAAAELAAYAADKKITKAQARAELKAAEREEALQDASGELLALPAVVDRAGHVIPVTEEQAGSIVRACLGRTGGALTVDVETSGYPVGHVHHELRSVQLGDEVAAVVLHPVTHAELIRVLLAEATTLHAHSASADLVPLAHVGLIEAESGWARMFDTVIPAKLGDPKSTGSDPALKQLSGAVLGERSVAPLADAGREAVFKAGKWLTRTQLDTPVERSGWAQIDTRCTAMLRYAASDVLDTAALARRLPAIPDEVMTRERIAEEMTARIAHRGIQIDYARVRELDAEHTRLRGDAATAIQACWAIENPGSGPQVAAALAALGVSLPMSEKGNPSVAEHVLSVLKRVHPDSEAGELAKLVLDYRHSNTVLGLFLAPYRQLCELGDGRVRPTVYTLGTDTGRMSCVRPNAQQLSRAGGIRSIYTADPGMVLISADFSGVELRGAAALSQDPTMIHMITEEDAGRFDGFHWAVARQAFGPDATKEDRYTAKRGVFGHIYGGGIATLAKQVGVPEQEMAAIVDSLKALTPGLASWSDTIRSAVRQGRTQFKSYSGRIIHFPREFPHKAPNYAIQGSCRELLVDALVRWRDTRWGNATLLPVHDELIVMVPAEDTAEATQELVRCMEGDLYGVRIVADPGKPETWGATYWRDSS